MEFQGHPMRKNEDFFFMAQNQNFKLGILKGDVKYMVNGLTYIPEAYNLTEDPFESNNLIKSEKDEEIYFLKYGRDLYKWYNCQMNYYSKEKYKNGFRINC